MRKCLRFVMVLLISFLINPTFAQNSWVEQSNPLGTGEDAMIGQVQFVSPTEGWISGSNGDLLHTTNAGSDWLLVTPFPNDTVWSSSDPALSMSWVNATHGWKINSIGPAYGNSYGVVLHSTTNGGNTWQKKVLSTTEGDFGFEIQFADVNNGWLLVFNFATQTATFMRTTDGGNNWVPFDGAGIFFYVDANTGWSFYGSGMNGADPPYKILRTTNGGTNWTEQYSDTTAGGYNAMYFSDQQYGWIIGDNAKVMRTTDGGTTWNFITNSGISTDYRSKSVFFLDANNGWISSKDGAGYGTLQHTTNGGTTWSTQVTPLQNTQGGNSIFSIYFVDAQHGWLTADYGYICGYTGTTAIENDNGRIKSFALSQNYPNPFNPSTRIQYSTDSKQFITLKVYNVLGNEVATLVNEEKPAGNYSAVFNGHTYGSQNLASGVYLYRLTSGTVTEARKMILMK